MRHRRTKRYRVERTRDPSVMRSWGVPTTIINRTMFAHGWGERRFTLPEDDAIDKSIHDESVMFARENAAKRWGD